MDNKKVVSLLNEILEMELAGVVRYTHYSLMVYGFNRLPIVEWLRAEAAGCLTHAEEAGEMVTHLGAHPSLGIGRLLETEQHGVEDILRESMEMEIDGLNLYRKLLSEVDGHSVMLEEYARGKVLEEQKHLGEVDKMLRSPGAIDTYTDRIHGTG